MQAFNGYESEDHQTYKKHALKKRADGYVYWSGEHSGRAWASFKSAKKCIDIQIKKAKANG